jgi:hypothetical protein
MENLFYSQPLRVGVCFSSANPFLIAFNRVYIAGAAGILIPAV